MNLELAVIIFFSLLFIIVLLSLVFDLGKTVFRVNKKKKRSR